MLTPGGVLFLIWNQEDPVTAWEKEIRDVAQKFNNTHRRFSKDRLSEVFNGSIGLEKDSIASEETFFSMPLQDATIKWSMWLTKQAVWDQFSTKGFIETLSDEEREVRQNLISIAKGLTSETDSKG